MAQRFISAFGLALIATAAYGQAFGRFGYKQAVDVPGLKVDREGFVANDPLADKFRFASPSKEWKPTTTSDTEQVVQLSTINGSPSQLLFNLLGPGFSLYFDAGIDFRLRSTSAPYLSWEQGSVAENVATPDVGWLVLSFRDRQPPIVFGFPGGPTSLTVTGKPGAWSIRSSDKFKGWVRIALPEGLDSQLANSAGALGRLARQTAAHVRLWTTMPPRMVKRSLSADLHSVTATWQFDHGGVVVPPAAELANLGGYLLQIQSPTVRLPGWTEVGPTDVLTGSALTIRFPVRRVPTGRCLAVGAQLSEPLGTASPDDIPSVAQLGLESLVSERDAATRKAAEDTTAEYVSQANYFMEPWTQQQLPFDANGKGIDLAAAHAFLMQAITSTSRATSESNSLLTSVCWRQDWLTWRVWTMDEAVAERAGALAALAGAFCSEPERRLSAAMFQAGLSATRGLNIWNKRKGFVDQLPKILEVLYGVRKGLFGLEGAEGDGERFALMLLSPLRIFSDNAVSLTKRGPELVLQTSAVEVRKSVLMLASAFPIEASALTNVTNLKVSAALGFTELHYTPETAGICEFKLTLPAFGQPPPPAVPVPAYGEIFK